MSDTEVLGKDSGAKDTGEDIGEPAITLELEEAPTGQGGPNATEDQVQQKSVCDRGPGFEKPFASSTPTLSPSTSTRGISSSYRYKRTYHPMSSYSSSSSKWRSDSVMDRIQARATAILDRDMALDRKAKLDGAMEPTSYSAAYGRDDDVEKYRGSRYRTSYKPQYKLDSSSYRDSSTSSGYDRQSSYTRRYNLDDDSDIRCTSSVYTAYDGRFRSRDSDYTPSHSTRSSHSSLLAYSKLKSLLNEEKPSVARNIRTSEITNSKWRGYLKEVENIDSRIAAAMPKEQRECPEKRDMYLVTYKEKYVPVDGPGVTEAELEPIRIRAKENIEPLVSDDSSLYKVGRSGDISDRRVTFDEDDTKSTGSSYLDSVRQTLREENVSKPTSGSDENEYRPKVFRSRFLQSRMEDTRSIRPRSLITDDDGDSDDDYYNYGNCRVNTDRYFRRRRNKHDDLDSIMYRYGAYNPRENYAVEDTTLGVSTSYANSLINRYNRQKELGVYYDRERSDDVKAMSVSTSPRDIHSRCYHGSTDFIFENRYRLPNTTKHRLRSSAKTHYSTECGENDASAEANRRSPKTSPVTIATTNDAPTITVTTVDKQDLLIDVVESEEESFTVTETKLERPSHEE